MKKRWVQPRQIILLAVVFLVAALDLGTKRWAEDSLATWDHMLLLSGDFANLNELLHHRFSSHDDGHILKLAKAPLMDLTQTIHQAVQEHEGLRGLVVFDPAQEKRFGRYAALPPDTSKPLLTWLKQAFPHLAAKGDDPMVFPVDHRSALVPPTSPMQNDSLYLLAKREIVVIDGFWDFSYVENPAGAFSMLSSLDDSLRRTLFLTLSVVVVGMLLFLLIRPGQMNMPSQFSLAIILGGAIGNLVDRFMLGYVVDFIHMYYNQFHWPRYNIADIAITVGIGILLLSGLSNRRKDV